jgi:hypothetical protein
MESQRALPRCLMELMLEVDGSLCQTYISILFSFSRLGEDLAYRVSVVDSAFATSLGRLARNAPRQLIVRGI